MDIGHVVAAAHLALDAQLTAQGADEVTAGEREVSQREDFVSFFGQLVGKAAAEITFADSIWAVKQAAGADFAQLL